MFNGMDNQDSQKIPLSLLVFNLVLVLLVIIILLVRMTNNINVLSFIKENFFYFFIALVFAFLAISLIKIHGSTDIDITTKEGIGQMVKIYYSWAVNVLKNIGRVTGYATKQDWFVTNSTGAA